MAIVALPIRKKSDVSKNAAPHVVVISNSAWNIYNFRLGLIEVLAKSGYAVSMLATADGYEHKITTHLPFKSVRFYPLAIEAHGINFFTELKLLAKCRDILKTLKPDAVLTFTIKPNIYGGLVCKWLKIPYVATVSGLGIAFNKRSLFRLVVHLLVRLALKNIFWRKGAIAVVFQNQNDKNVFIQHRLIQERAAVLVGGSGVDLDFWQSSSLSPKKTSSKNKPFVFLMVCRLLWQKGVQEYVNAALLLNQKLTRNQKLTSNTSTASSSWVGKVQCQLLGIITGKSGEVTLSDVKVWEERGVIRYLGQATSREETRQFMQQADCIVLPTYYAEGVPRSLLEAASMSKPLIATNHVGCIDIVHHQKNGLLCQPKSDSDLGAKMEDMLFRPLKQRQAMGCESRRLVKTMFDEKEVFAIYQRLLVNALQDANRYQK